MVEKFSKELVKEMRFGKKTLKTYKLIRTNDNNKDIDVADLRKMADIAIRKYGAENVSIRAQNIASWYTLKSFASEYIHVEEYEDYHEGKVADPAKFERFFQVELTIRG